MSLWLRLLGSIALTTVWSLANAPGCRQWLQGLLVSSLAPPGPVARSWGRQQWWPKLVVCTYSAVEACVVAGASCTHTCSGGIQGRQQRLGPTVGALAVAGALVVDGITMTAHSHHGHTAVEAGGGGQAGDV